MKTTEILNRLEALSKYAADELKPFLLTANLDQYKAFVNMMYHYTLFSEANLKQAASDAHTTDLEEYFLHMAKEEQGHYLLAAKDLEGYGESIIDGMPEEVIAINNYWKEMNNGHANAYLGLVYVFENIAKYVGKEISDLLNRLEVTKKQGRWLSVHAEADLEHGDEAREIAEKYCQENPELMLESAKKATELWLAINRKPFSQPLLTNHH